MNMPALPTRVSGGAYSETFLTWLRRVVHRFLITGWGSEMKTGDEYGKAFDGRLIVMRSDGGISEKEGLDMFNQGHRVDSKGARQNAHRGVHNQWGHGLKCLIDHLVRLDNRNALVYSCHRRCDGKFERFVCQFGPGLQEENETIKRNFFPVKKDETNGRFSFDSDSDNRDLVTQERGNSRLLKPTAPFVAFCGDTTEVDEDESERLLLVPFGDMQDSEVKIILYGIDDDVYDTFAASPDLARQYFEQCTHPRGHGLFDPSEHHLPNAVIEVDGKIVDSSKHLFHVARAEAGMRESCVETIRLPDGHALKIRHVLRPAVKVNQDTSRLPYWDDSTRRNGANSEEFQSRCGTFLAYLDRGVDPRATRTQPESTFNFLKPYFESMKRMRKSSGRIGTDTLRDIYRTLLDECGVSDAESEFPFLSCATFSKLSKQEIYVLLGAGLVSLVSLVPAKDCRTSEAFAWDLPKQKFRNNVAMREAEQRIRWHQLQWLYSQVTLIHHLSLFETAQIPAFAE